MDSDCSDSASSIKTEGDLRLMSLSVCDGAIKFETDIGNCEEVSNLNLIPAYRMAKGESEVSCEEPRDAAWDEVGKIFEYLIQGKFKAQGQMNCWNNTELCEPLKGCNAGDGVLVYSSTKKVKGSIVEDGPLYPRYPEVVNISSPDNLNNYITLNPRQKYIIHGDAYLGYELDLINLPRKQIFNKYGLSYCPVHLYAECPITVCADTGCFLGQFAVTVSQKKVSGSYSTRTKKGSRRTTYLTENEPKIRVHIRSSLDLVVSKQKRPKLSHNVLERDGRLFALSSCGDEVSGTEMLCHRSLLDIHAQFCASALFYDRNGLCYSDGVLFNDGDQLRKFFLPVGEGRHWNSYTGKTGKLEANGRRVIFDEVGSNANFRCPGTKFRVT